MQTSEISLREYLHQLAKRTKDPPCIDFYDEFLIKVWEFFSLRVAAEQYYESHRYVAYSRHGALPVSWNLLRETWRTSGPPEQPITQVAKKNYNDVHTLLGNLRKVLNRIRQKVSIAQVQQVDSHCLRWLTRQPGRSAVEKAGNRQEILGVVRIENYDTLENRVLKDFLSRCIALSTMYLRRYDKTEYHNHATIRSVNRFKNLCVAGLSCPEFENVRDLTDFPQPNYVLQQDARYSKVWSSYCDILRQEDVAEKLWDKRNEVDELYERCVNGIQMHCSEMARYDTPLWINPLDGRRDILESPIWDNELSSDKIVSPPLTAADIQVIDFTYPWDGRDEVVYPTNHRNARPFIQNPHRPSLEPGEVVSLSEILRKRDGLKLHDYFKYLHGLISGLQWIVLAPDDWEPQWLETVKRSRPSALTGEGAFFLLWRSIAAALGAMEGREFTNRESLVVADGFAVPFYNVVELRFRKDPDSGRMLPQRSSTRLHSGESADCQDVRFLLKCAFGDQASVFKLGGRTTHRVGVGRLSPQNFVQPDEGFAYAKCDDLLEVGVLRFIDNKQRGLVSYFDELDALSLVVQNRAEEVEFKTLVKHNECWPGGRPYNGVLEKAGALQIGATKLSLNLLEGEQRDDVLLKEVIVRLEERAPETADFRCEVSITPGQGLANVQVKADFLEKPLPLDLMQMKVSENTKARIERDMRRHFPPVMPFVEASEDIWNSVSVDTERYLKRGVLPNETGLFYHPQPYWGTVDPAGQLSFRLFGRSRFFDEATMSPVDMLKRENVFGNAPGHEYPIPNFDWNALFKRLAYDYRRGRDVLRMIAWTYQYKNEEFEFIRVKLHKQYVRMSQALSVVEYTFCANCFGRGDKRVGDILRHVLERIAGNVASENELRLTYNLLQFHPEAVENIESELCERAFMRLYRSYNTYPFIGRNGYLAGAQATKMIGYHLKCMLFLLHRRRYDPAFMFRREEWQPTGFLASQIPVRRLPSGQEYPTQRAHENLRVSFLNYVRGHGTIDGIPLGD